jgi:hypothetical protein
MPSATLRVVFSLPGTLRLPAFWVGAAERPGRHSHAERGNENPKIARCRCYSLEFFIQFKERMKVQFRQVDLWMTTYLIEVL